MSRTVAALETDSAALSGVEMANTAVQQMTDTVFLIARYPLLYWTLHLKGII